MRNANRLLTAAFLITALSPSARAEGPVTTRVSAACTPEEQWGLGSPAQIRHRGSFEETVSGKTSAAGAYALATALERSGASLEERALGTYWKAHSLLKAGLSHLAWESFASIAAREPRPETHWVQAAALTCLNRIRRGHPGLPMDRAVGDQLRRYLNLARSGEDRQAVYEFASGIVTDLIANKGSASEVRSHTSLLKGSAEAFARGLWHASRNEHARTVAALEPWLKSSRLSEVTPDYLNGQLPHARLLLGRAYYTLGKHALAAEQYALVDTRSNEIAEAISERAWSHLLADRRADAIGTAMSLEVGAMKKTFAPESAIIMAMAFNELCQYPAALRAAKLLDRNYDPTHRWLRQWAQQRARPTLYSLALQYLRNEGEGFNVPARLAGEWIRGNRFIALQSEISASFRESKAATAFNEELREESNAAALADWRARSERWSNGLGEKRRQLASEIERDLSARSLRMLAQLDEVKRNSRFIAIEIFQGASHDMIWKNAQGTKVDPDRLKSQTGSAASVYKFGGMNTDLLTDTDSNVEVWEDEIGALKADLDDNCSSKTKYLALMQAEKR